MNKKTIRIITGTAILLAIEIIFTLFGVAIHIGTLQCNLAIIPIALGAILYGPWVGFGLGAVNGLIVALSPETHVIFGSGFGVFVTCILKTGLAGLVSGFLFKAISKKNLVAGVAVSSLVVPVINTGLFIVGSFLLMKGPIMAWATSPEVGITSSFATIIFSVLVGFNFFFEFALASVLSPAIITIVKFVEKRFTARAL